MKILLIHPDYDKASLIATHSQTKMEAEFIIQMNANTARTILDLTPDCGAIVLYDPENPRDSQNLVNAAQKSKHVIKVVHFSDTGDNGTILFKDDLEYITDSICNVLVDSDKVTESEYKRIHLEYLQYFKETPVEVSLLINNKYVKILNKGDQLTNELIEKYTDKKVKYVYISHLNQHSFIQKLTEKFNLSIKKSPDQEHQNQVHETVFKLLVDFGLAPEVTQIAQKATEEILHQLDKIEGLQEILRDLYKKNASFRYKYNYMTSVIAYSLLDDAHNSWATEQHKQAIIFAAMFNDSLLDDDNLVKLRSDNDIEAQKISPREKELVLKHALLTAQQYQECEVMPAETAKIIIQHHGTLNGIGYSKELGGSTPLHPLTYFFIVAEEFSLKILTDPSKKVNVPKIVQNIQSFYGNKKIDQVIAILKSHLKIK